MIIKKIVLILEIIQGVVSHFQLMQFPLPEEGGYKIFFSEGLTFIWKTKFKVLKPGVSQTFSKKYIQYRLTQRVN